jgi:hypothetical protein
MIIIIIAIPFLFLANVCVIMTAVSLHLEPGIMLRAGPVCPHSLLTTALGRKY